MQNRFFRHIAKYPFGMKALIAFVMLWSLWNACNSSLKESALALWGLGLAMFFVSWREYNPSAISPFILKAIAFGLVGLSFLFSGPNEWCLFLIALGTGVFFDKLKAPQKLVFPFLIWIWAVPNCENLHLIISHPMRVIGAIVSAGVLNLFGISAAADGTMINIDGMPVAITTACSGVEQLEAMVLVGWLCASYMHRKTLLRLVHFSTIIPIILACNILRLTVTLAGAHKYGEVFLSDTVHTALGFATVFLVLLIFVGVGELFRERPDEKPAEAKEAQ